MQGDSGFQVVAPREVLLPALKDMLPVAPRSSYLPTLSYVLLTVADGRLLLRTSNINSGIERRLDPTECGPETSACVPAHPLAELVHLLPDSAITLTTTQDDDLFESDALNPQTGKPYSLGAINSDIQHLKTEWQAEALAQTGAHLGRIWAELQEVKREAWGQKDLRVVLAALGEEVDLLGLKNVTITVEEPDGRF